MSDEETKEETTEETTEETPAEETVEETPAEEVKAEEPKAEETKAEEPKAEEPKAEEPKKEEPKKEVSAKFKDLVEKIEKLSVLELSELVKELEERFGVSAAAPIAMVAGGAAAGAPAEAAEEKTSWDIVLTSAGAQKIGVIKAVREIKPDLGLKEAKDLVDAAPKDILKGVKKEEAEEAKKKLEAAGATVEMK